MRATVLYGTRDVRFEERRDPTIVQPTDAIIRVAVDVRVRVRPLAVSRACSRSSGPTPMGHEYCGIVEEVGREVRTVKPGPVRRRLVRHVRQHVPALPARLPVVVRPARVHVRGRRRRCCACRSRTARWWRPTRCPSDDLLPSLLATSDVLGTGWFAADAADVKPGATVAVVGDGAVGLLGVLSAKQMGAERIIAMSRHESRQALAREFGATDIVTERGDEGVARIKELTKGVGADSVLECVGTQESMMAGDPARRARADPWATSACRTASRSTARRCSSRTCACTAAPRRCAGTCPTLIDLVLNGHDRSRQGVRPDAAARPGRRGLPRDGRAPRDQDAAASLTGRWVARED